MKTRIEELAQQASDIARKNNPYWNMSEEFPEDKIWREKFAELIVKECGQVLESYDPDFDWATVALKNHFGIE